MQYSKKHKNTEAHIKIKVKQLHKTFLDFNLYYFLFNIFVQYYFIENKIKLTIKYYYYSLPILILF